MHSRRPAGRGILNANPIRIRPAIDQACVVIQPRLCHRAGPLEELRCTQCRDRRVHREEVHRDWVREFSARRRALWPDLLDRSELEDECEDEQVRHLGIAQHASNAENRHIDLVGQPVCSAMAAEIGGSPLVLQRGVTENSRFRD